MILVRSGPGGPRWTKGGPKQPEQAPACYELRFSSQQTGRLRLAKSGAFLFIKEKQIDDG